MKSIVSSKIYLALTIAVFVMLTSTNLLAQTDVEQADANYQAQQWQQAADAYRALSDQDDTNGLYWFRLGQSLFNLQQHKAAIKPLQLALKYPDENVPMPVNLLLLARSQAADGKEQSALKNIAAIEATGARPYQAVKNSAEFSSFNEKPEFLAMLEKLKPCGTPDHRAFDFWVGEWEVTSPSRPGWVAQNSITLSNDDCSVHENYTSGGYTGSSINFYDNQKQQWHQTWIDNQGASVYLGGNLVDGAMVLTNETNRVTWSVQPDKRVRQHWESTSDEGATWATAFDGYYRKK